MSGFSSLDELARRPDATVLIVHAPEDAEPAAHVDAARRAYPAMIVLTLRGSRAFAEAFAGRDVVLWPWGARVEQRASLRALEDEISRQAKRLRVISPRDVKEELGPADLNGHDPIAWARQHAVEIKPQVEYDLDAEWFGAGGPITGEAARAMLEDTHELVSDWTPTHVDMIEGDEWPETAIDVFARAAVPHLQRGILPPSVEPFVFDQSEIVGSDPCILATSALVCLAACTHDSIKLQPRRFDPDWKESARLWGAFVGDPSSKKSPALARAMSHLRKLDIDMAEETERQMPAYRLAEKRHKRAEDKAVDNLDMRVPDAPEKPLQRRLIAEDTTVEKLSDLLVDNRGGLLIHHDELSGFFGSFDAYRSNGGKDQAFWLQAYNGGARRVDRISRGSVIVPNLSVCIIGGIQPDKIRELAGKLADDGLVQRFMVTIAVDPPSIGADRAPDRTAIMAYRGILDWLVKERGNDDPVRLSDGAIDVMTDVEERLKAYRNVDAMPTRLRSHLGKWDGLFCRLALLYHVVECMDRGESHAGLVSQANAERVRLFLLDYLLPHTMAFYDDVLGNSGALGHVQWIAGYLLTKGETEVSTRDIFRVYRPWRALTAPQRDQIMSTLEVCGWIRPIGITKRQTAARWSVNPLIGDQFQSEKESEQKRRAEAKERLLSAFMNGK